MNLVCEPSYLLSGCSNNFIYYINYKTESFPSCFQVLLLSFRLFSAVYFGWRSFPNHLYPLFFFWTFILTFPVDLSLIGTGSRPLFDYLLLIRSQIRKTGITTKPIFDLLLSFFFFLEFFKGLVTTGYWTISPWGWNFRLSFLKYLVKIIMLFSPILPVPDALLQFFHWFMWMIVPRSRDFFA